MTPLPLPGLVALVPAREGSQRVPRKNIRPLGPHPLIAYTIAPALASGIFERVVVSTDSDEIAAVARHYGAEVPFLRPPALATALSLDIDWVQFTLRGLAEEGYRPDCFSILRPTSPFRRASTLQRAWSEFRRHPEADSIRAVELCRQHPAKMWVLEGDRIVPLLRNGPALPPWHSQPYQALPPVYAQNASLEIARVSVALDGGTIAGDHIVPFFTTPVEGLDLNEERDFWYAEHLLATGSAEFEPIPAEPYRFPAAVTSA